MRYSKSKVVVQFQKQLYEEYHIKKTDLVECLMMYLGFLIHFCNNPLEDKPLGQFEQWQIDDMIMSIRNDKIDKTKETLETLWEYSRRLGKTKNASVLAVFLAMLGYLGMWRASYTDQLYMAQYWFMKNPFVIKVRYGQTNNRIEIVNSPNISFDVIAPGKTQSRGVDFIMLDEECMIDLDSKKYDVYEKLRPCLADGRIRLFLHFTTPELNTVEDMTFHYLKDEEVRRGTKLVAEHPWWDSHWITEEFIAGERLMHADDPYYVALQYELKRTVLGGKVFENVIRVGDPKYPMFNKEFMEGLLAETAGVDFNGDINQHYLVTVKYDDNFIYILDEIKFTDLQFLIDWHSQNQHISLELEDGLYNDQFTKQTKRMGLACIYNMNWSGDSKGDRKMVRVQELRNRKIIIDKAKCPKTYDNLNTCAFDRRKNTTQIKKTKDQHGLDCVLHALHEKSGEVVYSRTKVRDSGLRLNNNRMYDRENRMRNL